MNDMILFGSCFIAVVVGLLCFALYNIYNGVYDSLANANIGTVYNFRYFQPVKGTHERYLAKVVDIRNLDVWELGRLNMTSNYRRYDKDFHRSPTLVTCQMSNGECRQFYAERSDMCRRSAIGGLLFRAGVAHLF